MTFSIGHANSIGCATPIESSTIIRGLVGETELTSITRQHRYGIDHSQALKTQYAIKATKGS